MTILCPTCSELLERRGAAVFCESMHGGYWLRSRSEMKQFDAEVKKYLGTFKPSSGRKPTLIILDDDAKTLKELSEMSGRNLDTLKHRIARGWPTVIAMEHEPFPRGEYLK